MKLVVLILTALILTQISGCGLISGCGENELSKLTEESRKWVPYESDAKLVFTHASSSDTIFVTSLQEEIEPFIRGDECTDGRMEVIEAKLNSKLFSDTISFRIDHEDQILLENDEFYLSYRDSGKSLVALDDGKQHLSTVTIEDRIFKDAIISRCQECNGLNEIVFAKNEGLVAYKIDDLYWIRQ